MNQRVWRCLSRLENGTTFCADSVTVDDEKIKQAVMRGISSAVKDRKDVLDLILSNLAYAVTGQDGALDVYALEKQLKALNDIMDETMELAANSSGDGKRFQQEIKALSEQMVVIREQLEMAKEKIASNEKINSEIENIKEYLSSSDICFTEYESVRGSHLCSTKKLQNRKSTRYSSLVLFCCLYMLKQNHKFVNNLMRKNRQKTLKRTYCNIKSNKSATFCNMNTLTYIAKFVTI